MHRRRGALSTSVSTRPPSSHGRGDANGTAGLAVGAARLGGVHSPDRCRDAGLVAPSAAGGPSRLRSHAERPASAEATGTPRRAPPGRTVAELTAGVRRTPPAETLLACARDLALLDLLVLVDCALHCGDVSAEELAPAAGSRRRGAPLLRRALAYADGRSESPWETLLRILHVVCGIDVEPQHELVEHGVQVARGDLRLRGTTTLHEYDGGDHLERRRQRKDLKRSRRLGDVAWTRRGCTREDVLHQGVGILRDADSSIGRPHDPRRIRAWNALLRESCFTPSGLARLSRRFGLATDDGASASGHSATA